jgi:hypothetical protein
VQLPRLVQELLPVHDAAVPGEEAGGAVVPRPGGGDHHVRGQAHAPHPRHAPRQHPPPRRAGGARPAPPPPPRHTADAAHHGRGGAVRAGQRRYRRAGPPAAARRRLPPRHAADNDGPCYRSDERGNNHDLVAVSSATPDATLDGAGLRALAGHDDAVLRPQQERRRQHPALSDHRHRKQAKLS